MQEQMTANKRAQIQLNAVQLYVRHIEAEVEEEDDEEITKQASRLLLVLGAYCAALERYLAEKLPTFDEFVGLKQTIQIAYELMCDIKQNQPGDMRGWHHGIEPSNNAQHLANVISEIIHEMALCTMQMEESMPAYKLDYQRIQLWQQKSLPIQ